MTNSSAVGTELTAFQWHCHLI